MIASRLSPVLGFVLRHEALVGWAAVLAGAALLGGVLAHRFEAPKLVQARAQVAEAQARAASAQAAARMSSSATAAVETARTRETTLTHAAQEAADAVVHAPQADAPVPPDVLRGWALGVDRLRDQASAARPLPPIPVAQVLRDPCPRPDRPAAPTVGELAAFSVRQEAALGVCEARKDAAVALIDAQARAVRP